MKKTNRLAASLLTIGISIMLVALIRANPNKQGVDLQLESYESRISNEGLWAPQKVWLQLTTDGQKINLYVLDQNGITQWKEQQAIAPILTFENVSQTSNKFLIPTRNNHAILMENPTDANVRVNLTLTFYDLETDLATMAALFFVIGIIIPPTYHIKKLLEKKNKSTKPNILEPK